MKTAILQGRLSQVQHATETYGAINRGRGQINSANAWSFRVEKHAAVYKSRGGASLTDGDLVTVAGKDAQGTFKVAALRNDTTGAVHKAPALLLLVLGGVIALCGLPLLLLLIGFFIVPLGLWIVWSGLKMRDANCALEAAPNASAAGSGVES